MNHLRSDHSHPHALFVLVKYYDPNRSEDIHCHDCGWQGAVDASRLNPAAGTRDYRCPCCSAMLAMVSEANTVRGTGYSAAMA